ncbi:uncharacterized protein Aud_006954 [Aspergillus udagawae]|uniref:Sterigmatocystin 8-O-methyltransferase n=1 Tax=Aspergillus udagawae TaxID=91492 RepID=A0A8E0QSV9_9EURO|nr:uncharacterized protein Aud_006954 [Aspergillus udagawae]GIC90519.1 hypothetical protein Aud_006954 [Aspergillus udagawae]
MTITLNPNTRVEALSSLISQKAPRAVRDVLQSGSATLPDKEQSQIREVIDACQELTALLTEPHEWISNVAWGYVDSVALSLVLEMKIHHHVPQAPGAISLSQLTENTGGSMDLIKRVMRQCVKRFIFDEVEPHLYCHNSRSIRLLDTEFSSLIDYLTDDGFVTGAHLSRSLSQSNFQIPDNHRQAAFQLTFNTDKTLYEYYDSVDLKRGNRFANAMAGHYNTPLDDPIESIYPFDSLKPDAQIVDIGGGKGQQSIRLGRKYAHMSFIVQDLGSVVESAQTTVDIPETVTGRIQWQAHNMYSPQPLHGADVYLLSHVMMDHPTSACVTILQHIVKAMKPGHSRILIHDFLDPEKQEYVSRFLNELDFHMIASLNCFSKSLKGWLEVFRNAETALQLKRVFKGSKNSAVFELILEDD